MKNPPNSKRQEYFIWATMVQRCTNPNSKDWLDYGGRGIEICDSWMKFQNFFDDMGEKPNGKSLDRIDNDKGYSPDNCRWADTVQQARNKRLYKNSTTGIRGVCLHYGKYRAQISVRGKIIIIGSKFNTAAEAQEARKQAEKLYWSE